MPPSRELPPVLWLGMEVGRGPVYAFTDEAPAAAWMMEETANHRLVWRVSGWHAQKCRVVPPSPPVLVLDEG